MLLRRQVHALQTASAAYLEECCGFWTLELASALQSCANLVKRLHGLLHYTSTGVECEPNIAGVVGWLLLPLPPCGWVALPVAEPLYHHVHDSIDELYFSETSPNKFQAHGFGVSAASGASEHLRLFAVANHQSAL